MGSKTKRGMNRSIGIAAICAVATAVSCLAAGMFGVSSPALRGPEISDEWFLNHAVYGVNIGMSADDAKRILDEQFQDRNINFDNGSNRSINDKHTPVVYTQSILYTGSIRHPSHSEVSRFIPWLNPNKSGSDRFQDPTDVTFALSIIKGSLVVVGYDITLPYDDWDSGFLSKYTMAYVSYVDGLYYVKSYGKYRDVANLSSLQRIDFCTQQSHAIFENGATDGIDIDSYYNAHGCTISGYIPKNIYAYAFTKSGVHSSSFILRIRDPRFISSTYYKVLNSLRGDR